MRENKARLTNYTIRFEITQNLSMTHLIQKKDILEKRLED